MKKKKIPDARFQLVSYDFILLRLTEKKKKEEEVEQNNILIK